MSENAVPMRRTAENRSLGDRMRTIANQLRQENDIQIKATARILGAAAQLAQNQDRLIDEVVDMVEDDLAQSAQERSPMSYTVPSLKQQFKTLKEAAAHFGVKASKWGVLVDRLNQQVVEGAATANTLPSPSIPQRLDAIEQELQGLRADTQQIVSLLQQLVHQKE